MTLNIVMAQLNTFVGDFQGNTDMVIEAIARAESAYPVPVVVFPERRFS